MKTSSHAEHKVPNSTVLFVSISGWRAGPGRSLTTVLAHLPRDLRRVLAAPAGGDLVPWLKERNLIDEYVELTRLWGRFRPKEAARLRSMIQLGRWMLRHRHELVAVHANGSTELHLTAPGAALARVPLVVWFHGSSGEHFDPALGALWRHLPSVQQYAAVSEIAEEVAINSGLARVGEVHRVPNPIDPADTVAQRGMLFQEHSAADTDVISIAYMGGHSASKGFDLLPDIVRAVDRGTHRSIRWLLFCDGIPDNHPRAGDWPKASDLARSEVRFVGRVSDPRDAYAQADLVLQPSFVESFGRVCAEAMANGIPVVASDIPGLRAVVGNDEAGLLFPRGDSEAAAAALVRLVNDLELREVLGGRGRIRARQWGPAEVTEAFLQLYGWHTSDARIGPGSIEQ